MRHETLAALCGSLEIMLSTNANALSNFISAGGLEAVLDELSQTTNVRAATEMVRVLKCVSDGTKALAALGSKAHYDVAGVLRHTAVNMPPLRKDVENLLQGLDNDASRSPLRPIV